MRGLAASCGTEVEPTCSSSSTRSPRAPRSARLALVETRPRRVVLGQRDRRVEHLGRAYTCGGDLLVAPRRRLRHRDTLDRACEDHGDASRNSLCEQRGRRHRIRGRRNGRQRPRLRAGLRLEPRLRVGDAVLAAVLRTARAIVRLILFDKRGTGLSDHGPHFAALETRMEDLRAVLDAAGSERAVVLVRTRAAAWPRSTRPHTRSGRKRSCSSTRLRGASPRRRGSRREIGRRYASTGGGRMGDELLRGRVPDPLRRRGRPALVRELAARRREPAVATGSTARSSTPTSARCSLRSASRRSSSIAGAPWEHGGRSARGREADARARSDARLGQRLLRDSYRSTSSTRSSGSSPVSPRRRCPESVLTTVAVHRSRRSTEHASTVGDSGWRQILARAPALVRRELARFRGEERDTAGRRVLRDVRRTGTRDSRRRGDRRRGRRTRARRPGGRARRRVRGARRQADGDRSEHRVARGCARAAGRGARHRNGPRPRRRIGAPVRRPRGARAQRGPGTLAPTRRAPRDAAQPGSASTSASVRRAWAANGGFVSQ